MDADALVDRERAWAVARGLVENFGWVPLTFDANANEYVDAEDVTVLTMEDDPVLMDIHEHREMIPLRTESGLTVELLAAQHPVEEDAVLRAGWRRHQGILVPVASLGSILLLKAKADRDKDRGALEQVSEHVSAAELEAALVWVAERDPATAEDLKQIVARVRKRRTPSRLRPARRR